MYLTYKDFSQVFSKTRGIRDDHLEFHTVAFSAMNPQPKGIFIPLFEDSSGELKEAIENGAIAAVWEEKRQIPKYTPNHFPIFFTNDNDRFEGLRKILLGYKIRLQKETDENENKTKFFFFEEELLNEFYETYDIAVIDEKWNKLLTQLSHGGKE